MQEGIGREKMESIKYAENMAEIFGSNTLESPTGRVVVVKTKRTQRDKRAFPFLCLCVSSPSLRRVDALFCCTPCIFLFFPTSSGPLVMHL